MEQAASRLNPPDPVRRTLFQVLGFRLEVYLDTENDPILPVELSEQSA